MVHQHFMLIPVMTVAENIVLAEEPTLRRGDARLGEARKRGARARPSASASPSTPTRASRTSPSRQQQRVEILKALYRGAEILDPRRADRRADAAGGDGAVRDHRASLQAQGKSIIFITHKLHEVLEVADRITVLRRGKKVDTVPREGATEESLARMMVGREVLLRVDKPPATPGEPLLEVEDLHVFDDRGLEKVRGVSFEVRAGEIVGIAGVDGNGQTELIDAITGLRRPAAGTDHGRRASRSAPRERPRACSTSASATSPRTASGAGSCSSSRSPRTSRCTTTASRPTRGAAGSTRAV